MTNYAVEIDGYMFCVVSTKEEAREVIEGVKRLNRWYRYNIGCEYITATDSEPTDPFARGWVASWIAGNAGWDLAPILDARNGKQDEMVVINREEEKKCRVNAPTALLAIERAKVLLMKKGKRRE